MIRHPVPGEVLPRRMRAFDKDACSCQHEDWQHGSARPGVQNGSCAGGKTGNSCPCTARWHEAGWEQPSGE